MRTERLSGLLVAAAALALVACGGVSSGTGSSPTPTADVGSGQLQGAGATFPEPFYTRAFYAYNQKYSQVTVNYQAIGSGGGISQFTKGTVDFGASDPAIAALNSGVSLPSTDITVVHRSDSSGTSYGFTDYLSKISPDWKSKVGVGKAVSWPAGIGGAQNAGVGQAVKTTEGAIGYVELAYVIQSQLQYAFLKNANGKYAQASIDGATSAAAALTGVSPTNFSITNEAGDKTYPIASYSWVILRIDQTDATKGKAVVNLWKWVVTDGQTNGKSLQYAALPKEAQDFALAQLKTVKSGGKAILS